MIIAELCKATTCKHHSINFEDRGMKSCAIDDSLPPLDAIVLDESGQCMLYEMND